jgi:N-acetylglutamate synthase-like GNAT family acetyltransferase
MIRPATKEDMEWILDMTEEDCNDMGYPHNRQHIKAQMMSLLALECPIFINEHNNEKVGVIAGIVAQNLFDPAILEIREFIWHASKTLNSIARARVMVELLDYLVELAKQAGIVFHASLPAVPVTESLNDLLLRRGFKLTEHYYRLES